MKIPSTLTARQFVNLVKNYLENEVVHDSTFSHLVHKNCGGAIRTGFYLLFKVNESGLQIGNDGFGIGPRSVPYCEKCDPPDGFRHTYSKRIGIISEENTATN